MLNFINHAPCVKINNSKVQRDMKWNMKTIDGSMWLLKKIKLKTIFLGLPYKKEERAYFGPQ